MQRLFIKRFGAIALAAALLAAFAWVALTQGPMAPPKVVLSEVRMGELAPQAFGIGTVEARLSYAIGAVQAGRLSRVMVDQGNAVKRGEVLAEIDPVDLDERLAAARSAHERARHSADAAAAQMSEAKARQQMAQASAKRYRDLARQGFVSGDAVDAKDAEAEATRAGADAAASLLAASRQEIHRANAEVAALAKQRANLRLASPVDGIVTAREAEAGDTVVAGQAVIRVIDPASLWVRVRIDQGRAGGIAPGQAARVVLRSRRGEELPGKVVRIELQSDPVTEERLVDVAFDQPPAGWSIGELAEVTIQLPKVDAGLFVPSQAVQRLGQQTGVWQIDQQRARFVAVRTGASTLDGRTQILEGLRAGDTVITYSQQALQPDMRVRAAASLISAAR